MNFENATNAWWTRSTGLLPTSPFGDAIRGSPETWRRSWRKPVRSGLESSQSLKGTNTSDRGP